MTLQDRILEALGERALTPRALYEHLSNDMPAAVDCALGALMRSGKVTRELGFYQRISPGGKPAKSNGAVPVASHAAAPLQSNLTVPSAAVSTTSMRTMGSVASTQVSVAAPTSALTAREQEIAELAAAGKTNREIAQLLSLKLGTVEVYRHNIRKKTGDAKLERRAETQPAPKSPAAPSAAPPLTAAPSREGAEDATAGAAPAATRRAEIREGRTGPSQGTQKALTRPGEQRVPPAVLPGCSKGAAAIEAAKKDTPARSLPSGLKARLVEVQRRKAEELKELLDQVGVKRQELADVEAMVRIVSEEGGA